jgi:hypothetical protein
MARISVKAVAVGGAVDIIATNILMLPIVVSLVSTPAVASLPSAKQTDALSDAMMASPTLYTSGLLLGSVCSVFGGWVAARIAGRDEMVHGALSAFACIIFGIYGLIAYPGALEAWEHAAFFVLTPALGAFGGLVRTRQKRNATSAASDFETLPRPTLRRWERGIYVANRILLAFWVLLFVFFVVIAAHGHGSGNTDELIGGILISILAGVTAVLFFVAGRALQASRRRHWWMHGAAVSLTLLSVLLAI